MIVQKFGGTSVGKPSRMASILNIVSSSEQKLIVLSALSGVTNSLVAINELLHKGEKNEARQKIKELENHHIKFVDELFSGFPEQIDELKKIIASHAKYMHDFTLDMFTWNEEKAILAQGELLSTAIFFHYAKAKGHDVSFINALDFMRTDKDVEPDYYYIKHNLNKELDNLKNKQLVITQGYICRNVYGEIDNLRRGGSDYSASLIGAAIGASEIQIWTDIDGMHNNDPRVVAQTKPVRQISFDEAAELAYFGAKILHPSSIRPAQEYGIPVWLKNTLQPTDEGTLISASSDGNQIKAIAAKDGITAIKIKSGRMLLAYGFLRKVFEVFERYKTSIDMITTSEVAVSLTIDDTTHIKEIEQELKQYGLVEVEHNKSIICIVGDFLGESKGYAHKVFDALKEIPLRMISYGGSKNNISVLIESEFKKEALTALNRSIFHLN